MNCITPLITLTNPLLIASAGRHHGVPLCHPAHARQQRVDAAGQAVPPPVPVPEGEPGQGRQLPQAAGEAVRAGPERPGGRLRVVSSPGEGWQPVKNLCKKWVWRLIWLHANFCKGLLPVHGLLFTACLVTVRPA